MPCARRPETAHAWVLLAAPPGHARRTARARLRRAGLRVSVADHADAAAEASLERDYLLVALAPELEAADGGALPRLLAACGYAGACVPLAAPRRLRRLALRRHAERAADEAMLQADPEFAALAAGYADELRVKLDMLEAALQADDAGRALGLVHDIKGTARPYGWAELSALAAAAQNAFAESRRADAWDACRTLMARAAAQGAL